MIRLLSTIQTVFVSASILLTGCGAVQSDLLGSQAKTDGGVAPDFNIPTGDLTLGISKVIGANRFVGLDNAVGYTEYDNYLLDSLNQMHHLATDAIYTYASDGKVVKRIVLDTIPANAANGKAHMAISSAGDYYFLAQTTGGYEGVYKVSSDGATQVKIIDSSNAHPLPPAQAYDMRIITNSSGVEELHIPANYLSSGTFGTPLVNEILVYGLDGTYQRAYGLAQNTVFTHLKQAPNGHIYAFGINNPSQDIYEFDADGGNPQSPVNFPSIVRIGQIAFDATGRFYISDIGDPGQTGGGPTVGVSVYSSFGGSLVTQLLTSVGHPIYFGLNMSVSPDGSLIDLYNNSPLKRERFVWNGSQYSYSLQMVSRSSAAGEFDLSSVSYSGGIVSDSAEKLYILDGGNERIQVFSSDGASLLTAFSVAHADINKTEAGRFIVLNSQSQLQLGGWRNNGGGSYDIVTQKYTKGGSLLSTHTTAWPYNAPGTYIGQDSKDVLWFTCDATDVSMNPIHLILGVDETGTIVTTIDYTNPSSVFGVSAVMFFQVVDDKLFYTDAVNGPYNLRAYDFAGNNTDVLTSTDYASTGLLAVIPQLMQRLSNGKVTTAAYTSGGELIRVILDPDDGYKVVTRVHTPTDIPVLQQVWTSNGIFALSTYDRVLKLYYY